MNGKMVTSVEYLDVYILVACVVIIIQKHRNCAWYGLLYGR